MRVVVMAGLALVFFAGIWAYWSYRETLPRQAAGTLKLAEREGAALSYYVSGNGPLVIMIPSLGRAASDFNELAGALNAAGFRTVAIDPRGMGESSGAEAEGLTLHDLAKDIDTIAQEEAPGEKIFVLGHAFGNRMARTYASDFPEKVKGTLLLAAGGKVPIAPRIRKALGRSFYVFAPDFWRRPEVELAFFADGNTVPDYWMSGWNWKTAKLQVAATQSTPAKEWWQGGSAPLLIIQAMQDTIAPPEHTSVLLKEEFGSRITVAEIENAGHALLPEQPEKIAEAAIRFLREKDSAP